MKSGSGFWQEMRAIMLAIVVLAPVLLAGCTAGQEELENEKNHFRYSLQGAGGNLKKEWSWETDGGDVAGKIAMQGASGSAKVTVIDARGNTAWTGSVSGGGQAEDSVRLSGKPSGTWIVKLEADGVAGQLFVELERGATGGLRTPW